MSKVCDRILSSNYWKARAHFLGIIISSCEVRSQKSDKRAVNQAECVDSCHFKIKFLSDLHLEHLKMVCLHSVRLHAHHLHLYLVIASDYNIQIFDIFSCLFLRSSLSHYLYWYEYFNNIRLHRRNFFLLCAHSFN